MKQLLEEVLRRKTGLVGWVGVSVCWLVWSLGWDAWKGPTSSRSWSAAVVPWLARRCSNESIQWLLRGFGVEKHMIGFVYMLAVHACSPTNRFLDNCQLD